MRKIMVLVLAQIALLAAAFAEPVTSPASMDELLQKSGMWRQIAQLEPLLQVTVTQQFAAAGQIDDAITEPLRTAISTAYAPERLREEMKLQLATALSPGDVKKVLAWLSSDLGKRFTALEEKSGEVEEYVQRQEESQQLLASLPRKRIALLKRFAQAVRAGETSAAMTINTTAGLTYGMSLVNPQLNMQELSDLRVKLERHKSQMVAMFEEQSIANFAVIYRAVSDHDLKKYIAFASSPVGKRYHAVVIQAFDNVLTKAATQLGREIATPSRSATVRSALSGHA